MSNNDARIAFGTDMGLLAPTALAMDSALRTTAISQVEILGVSLTEKSKTVLKKIAESREVPIQIHSLDSSVFPSNDSPSGHVPKTTLARLHLPQLVDGRVLYIDGDTLVRRDLGEIFSMPMSGNLIGGVRDFSTLKKEVKFQSGRSWSARKEVEGIVAPFSVESYINAGVFLMDCAAIRREKGLADAMLRFDLADKYPLMDQDYINELFKGRVLHINPSWNSSWGRHNLQTSWARKMGYSGSEAEREPARIIHYHGAEKPWKKMSRDRWKRSYSAVLAYKMALRSFQKRSPELTFD